MVGSQTCDNDQPHQPVWQIILHVEMEVACERCLQLSDCCNQESQPANSNPTQAHGWSGPGRQTTDIHAVVNAAGHTSVHLPRDGQTDGATHPNLPIPLCAHEFGNPP